MMCKAAIFAFFYLTASVMAADKPVDKKTAEKKLMTAGAVSGEVMYIDKSKQSLRVKVTYQYVTLDQGAYRGMLQAQQNYQRAAARRDINGMRSAQRSLAQNRARLYKQNSSTKEFTVEAAEGMKVRMKYPKPGFTETGEVKTYTPKELKKMRGKDRLFDGEWADIQQGQLVHVRLVREKKRPVVKDPDLLKLEAMTLKTDRIVIVAEKPPQ